MNEKLKNLIAEKKLTISALVVKSGVSKTAIHRALAGKTIRPDLQQKIAEALDSDRLSLFY